jgi:hypothetical protein
MKELRIPLAISLGKSLPLYSAWVLLTEGVGAEKLTKGEVI